MKVVRAFLRTLAGWLIVSGAYVKPESGVNVRAKPLPHYRGHSLLGAYLTETVQYHN